jgi:DNA-binding HxlR family transcriptional regulator
MRAQAQGGVPRYACPVDLTLDVIGRKWQPLILWNLSSGPLHYNLLQAALPDVSHKVLTQQLRDLERHHIISRTVSSDGRRVSYALTEFGRSLRPVLRTLAEWGKRHSREMGAQIVMTRPCRGRAVAFLSAG